ncbi:hypothetical protein KBD33_02605 [Candidatus Gracilibacteria bacterium]|nr:hypothetical protein [Candidatus Gracilibacteria bacterium]
MNLKNKILSKIQKEKIEPLPESYFIQKYRILWGLLGFTVLLGIIGSGFLIEDSSEFFGMIQYTRGDMGIFILPNIFWIILLLFLLFVGVQSLRHTAIGYRYPAFRMLILGIAIIFVGGYFFRMSGLGPQMHTFLVRNIPGVSDLLYNEGSWDMPENGRLAGTIIERNDKQISVKDTHGGIWDVSIQDSFISPMVIWEERIRILGSKQGDNVFIAEKILPWFGKGKGKMGRMNH